MYEQVFRSTTDFPTNNLQRHVYQEHHHRRRHRRASIRCIDTMRKGRCVYKMVKSNVGALGVISRMAGPARMFASLIVPLSSLVRKK